MAGRIRDDDVALVRDRSAIAAIVGDYLTLRSAGGAELKGLCPFHEEKSPSFHVAPARGFYHCFGCGEGGDVITFVQKVEHLSFAEAVERLASRAGIELHYEGAGPALGRQRGQRTRLVDAHTAAQTFYAGQLSTAEAKIGRDFLAARGFDTEAARAFAVGYAPAGWDALVKQLSGNGFTPEELVLAGLASQGRHGPIDRFRGRLVWPIRDATGDVIGFGARRLREDDTGPKYLNTPETPLYKKGHVLYGLDLAKKEIARRRRAVIVEGYTDVMACHLAGETSAVATCGTAFGTDHIAVLRRLLMDQDEFRGEVIFTFDGDAAGQQAALRAFEDDQRFVTQTFVAVQPDGMDPCELRLAKGDAAVRDLVAGRVPLFEFAIRSALSRHDLDTAEGRTVARAAGIAVVRRIRDVSLRTEYARRLAGWLGLADPNEVVAEARGELEQARRRPAPSPRTPGDDAARAVEREALKLAVQRPVLAGVVFDALDAKVFTHPGHLAVQATIAAAGGTAAAGTGGAAWVARLRELAADDRVRGLVTELAVEPIRSETPPDARYVAMHLARLQEHAVNRELVELKSRLQRLSPVEQPEQYNRLFGELVALEQHRRLLREQAIGGL